MSKWNIACFVILVVFCLLIELGKVECTTAEEDLTVTSSEKKALDKLKSRVVKKLPNDYMKTEIYLIRWIRAAGGDPEKGERLLKENLKWRKSYNMDNILNEDFSFMEEEYPVDFEGVDYFGGPVLVVKIGDWDVRKSHVLGQHDENYRYSMKLIELAAKKIRDAQAQGKQVTRFQVIFDMNGFNLIQHGCFQCLPPYLKFTSAFQNYYPELVDNFIILNAPQTLESVVQFIRPVSQPYLRRILKIFGTNPKEWQPALFKIIPKNQLDPSLGGTKSGLGKR